MSERLILTLQCPDAPTALNIYIDALYEIR
jgi:hypothetical protein